MGPTKVGPVCPATKVYVAGCGRPIKVFGQGKMAIRLAHPLTYS